MVTVHRVPVVDSVDEMAELKQEWQDYLDTARDYSIALDQYQEAIEKDADGDSRDVELLIDRLGERYDEMQMEVSWLDGEIEDSSLRGHASYPHLDEGAVRQFQDEYGVAPGEMMRENPQDFYFAVADELVSREGVEWRVENREVRGLEDLIRMVESCDSAAAVRIPVENPQLPDTEVPGEVVGTEVFEDLKETRKEVDQDATYQAVRPYERHVFSEYGRSVLEELWGMEMNAEVLDQIEGGEEFSTASD